MKLFLWLDLGTYRFEETGLSMSRLFQRRRFDEPTLVKNHLVFHSVSWSLAQGRTRTNTEEDLEQDENIHRERERQKVNISMWNQRKVVASDSEQSRAAGLWRGLWVIFLLKFGLMEEICHESDGVSKERWEKHRFLESSFLFIFFNHGRYIFTAKGLLGYRLKNENKLWGLSIQISSLYHGLKSSIN